ncbi:hypothetical protein ACJIZ3_025745 [Penstemon smallii]|uniref:Uncharacterized protein n=1 Tax=Penstemon smallii TaxID=265156 RepID=A0ABD3TVE3_9LAMI
MILVLNSEPIQDQPRAVAVELDISASEPIIKARVQEEWSSVVKTNQTGTWVVSKCVCEQMRDAKLQGCGGSVINISSISGLNRVQFHGGHAYSASKAAINSFTM